MSKNVACPAREAESTVVQLAVSAERAMVTETSGLDHVTKIDRQSWAMTDTPSTPPGGHASQTLENELRYARPPLGGCAMQARALRLIAHVVMPSGVVRQHVT